MKILDRYVLKTFLKNYLLSFLILVGLYIVLDMLFNFDELMSIQAKEGISGMQGAVTLVKTIGGYYFYQMFIFFVQLSGIIPVVAVAFTLMRMSRFNELSALLSAGVPLLRITVPIVLASVALNVLLIVDQELVIPPLIHKLTRSHDEAGLSEAKNFFPITAMEGDQNMLLTASRYTTESGTPTMIDMDVIKRDKDFQPVWHIRADRAVWDGRQKGWLLADASIARDLGPGQRGMVSPYTELFRNVTYTPDEIALYRTSEAINLLSTEHINQLLNQPLAYGTSDLLRVKNSRLAQPLINIILILLAIPCVLTRAPGGLRSAALKTLGLMGICLAVVFVTQLLAGHPPSSRWQQTWPALMCWIPIFIFGPVSIYLLDRVQT